MLVKAVVVVVYQLVVLVYLLYLLQYSSLLRPRKPDMIAQVQLRLMPVLLLVAQLTPDL